MLIVFTVVASVGVLRCYKDFPLRQLQCLVILQSHVAVAMITVGTVALLSPKTFPPIDSRRFGVGATALGLACLQVPALRVIWLSHVLAHVSRTDNHYPICCEQACTIAWAVRLLFQEVERLAWVQDQEDMDCEALMSGVIR